MVGVGFGEQQLELQLPQLAVDRDLLRLEEGPQVLVTVGQRVQLDQVAGAPLQTVPDRDLIPVLRRLPRQPAGAAGVVPDTRLGQSRLQLVGLSALDWEVKDAPSARGFA